MRKPLVAIAISTVLVGAASAQSTVTLFGIVDATLRDVKNGSAGSIKSLTTSGMNSTRLGVRGTEDLGGGLQAEFWVEHGFAVDSGTQTDAARFWNRRSTVSLVSKAFGEIRLGRDLSPSYAVFGSLDPFGDNGLGGISVLLSGLGSGVLTLTRADNLVSYLLPSELGGVFGQVGVAAGENVAGAKYAGAMMGWRNKSLLIQAAYAETTITTDKFKQTVVGGSFDFGVAKLTAQVTQGQYKVSKQLYTMLGAAIPVGPGLLRGTYTASDLRGPAVPGQALADADDASRIALGYIHNLSKRTAVYTTVARIRNKGASKVVLTGGPSGIKNGESSSGLDLGLRHSF